MSHFNFLFALTGSIACYKACTLISQLVQDGHSVKCIATKGALNFIGKATLEGLTGHKVNLETFEDGSMMDHIHLAKWADAVIVAPASANFIARTAHGMADDLLTTTLLAVDEHKIKFIAPAMNTVMWNNSKVQENINQLKNLGYNLLEPENGKLACGDTGQGRLLEPEKMYALITNTLIPSYEKRVLITSGGTREPIDGVRFITNFSTGYTGATLADELADTSTQVTLLAGEGAQSAKNRNVKIHRYDDFKSLKSQLNALLDSESYDLVIHAAAVSDFSVANPSNEKLSSEEDLILNLKRNEKLLPQLKNWSKNPNIKVVGFKLTSTENRERSKEQVTKALSENNIHALVHNDFKDISVNRSEHIFNFYHENKKTVFASANDLARTLKGALL